MCVPPTRSCSHALNFLAMTLIVLRVIGWSSRNCPKNRMSHSYGRADLLELPIWPHHTILPMTRKLSLG